jgi:DNA-binding transcriptional ArsR family regulator
MSSRRRHPSIGRSDGIAGNGPATASALAEPFDVTLAAVVQHLQVLEECGIVRSEKIGRVRTCRIEPGGPDSLAGWIAERRSNCRVPPRSARRRPCRDGTAGEDAPARAKGSQEMKTTAHAVAHGTISIERS